MKTDHAFTMLETLVVISIISLLAALLFPVFAQVKKNSQETSCASNMKQTWLALMLYRADYDADGKYGSSSEMGFPTRLAQTVNPESSPEKVLKVSSLKCPNWPSKLGTSGLFPYNWMYQDEEQMTNQNRWDDYAREFGEQSILVTDVNHNDSNIPVLSPTISKHGFGITLMGSRVKKRKPGDVDVLRWWSTDCTVDCPLR